MLIIDSLLIFIRDDKTILYIPLNWKIGNPVSPCTSDHYLPGSAMPFSPPSTNPVYNNSSTHQQRFGIQSLWFREAEGSR
jgi:hypothetical protein